MGGIVAVAWKTEIGHDAMRRSWLASHPAPHGDRRAQEGHYLCPHCLCCPCVISVDVPTRRQLWWPRNSALPHGTNNTRRKALYRKFWATLLNLGMWGLPAYKERKANALVRDK